MKNFFLLLFFTPTLFAGDVCSRSAIINHQEVLIDNSPHKPAEGLRFYLEKDPEAKALLDKYQQKGHPQWYTAALGTLGTSMVITSLFKSKEENSGKFFNRNNLLIGGFSLIFLDILLDRALKTSTEDYLIKSIDEYNKRNMPKIYFAPTYDNSENKNMSISAGIIKDF